MTNCRVLRQTSRCPHPRVRLTAPSFLRGILAELQCCGHGGTPQGLAVRTMATLATNSCRTQPQRTPTKDHGVSSGPVLQLGHRNAGGALSAHGRWSGSLLVLTLETGQIRRCSGRVERIGHGPTKATLEQKVEQAERTSGPKQASPKIRRESETGPVAHTLSRGVAP
jgi:hypothetical protein